MSSLTPVQSAALAALRQQLPDVRGPRYRRALEELTDVPGFGEQLKDAFPQLAMLENCLDRRGFLRLLSASLALGGLAACSGPPPRQIVPRVRQPEGLSPSLPQFYATSLRCGGDVLGVLVETHEGRPTKIEGNPSHPASLGATGLFAQAAVLELWDPDRSHAPAHRGVIATWDDFSAATAGIAQRFAHDGRGLHVLSGRIDSPTLAAQRQQLLDRYAGARWHQYEAIDDDNALAGARLAFNRTLQTRYRFDRARIIVALEADFLGTMSGHVRYSRDFAAARKPEGAGAVMTRLYAIDATPTLTGAKADHAWPLASQQIGAFALELARELGIAGTLRPVGAGSIGQPQTPNSSGIAKSRLAALVQDLRANHGASLVLAGAAQPAHVHALAHLINQTLGNTGHTVETFEAPEPREPHGDSLRALTDAMSAGAVNTLVILDGNPVYATPADLHFGALLPKVAHSIHAGLYHDETAALCEWHVPLAHALESWSDLRAYDGSAGIVQPVIAPLYGGHSVHEILAALLGAPAPDTLAIVRATWKTTGVAADPPWEQALRDGVIAGSAPPMLSLTVSDAFVSGIAAQADERSIELLFRADPTIWDGRYANNGWLQELPKPLTQLTWSNAALISPALAREHSLRNGDTVRVRSNGREIEAPVWVMPGQAARSATLPLGYGRSRAGHVGDGAGVNAFALRTSAAPWRAGTLAIATTGRRVELATTQQHHSMEGRAPVRTGPLMQPAETPPSLYPEHPPGQYSWGMSIDLNSCIGCNACTIACQAENNIPIVGVEEVRRGRELHWIRVDRYFEGSPEAPRTYHQPVPCMHCDHAPCEVVCPVGATVHDSEGLNLQVYNRCIGTRFCSNNCPYKVRRFNFLQYADLLSEPLKAQRNPEVSVRNRGVMEKCTYCIQRIETAHIAADAGSRRIGDGEVVTACQAACPTRAITFGNIADPASAVSREKASPRNYALLGELNTRPHTTYLSVLRNPHPDLGDDA